ncbi:hypothetical protein LCL97_00440 [Seohaeicola saemankumensis]|nr:hypothetical protein [Seohaeicola saemankumensis]MCA0869280.1 hypothetical protein [Seohaeicola saemankumensis]
MTTIKDIDVQIAELEKQKQRLIEEQKQAALQKAQAAVDELKNLGFHYALVESQQATKSGRGRRSGVRQDVLNVVRKHPDGIARSDLFDELDAHSKSAQQSISSALSALKKRGDIGGERGIYRPA